MIYTTFKELRQGDYFIPNKFSSVLGWPTFVKHGSDYGDIVRIDGLCQSDSYDGYQEFEPDFPVGLLEEGEWPKIDYRPEIEAWKWDYIKHQVEKNIFLDDSDSDNVKGSCWVGTTLGVMPSGKIYAMWTSNQTSEDVNRDQAFNEALEEVVSAKGFFVDWNDSNDLFISKAFTYQEVAKKAGYVVKEDPEGKGFYWAKLGEGWGDVQVDEDEAWKACCEYNRLVQE